MAREYHVSPNGSDSGDGTISSTFRQISTATARVQPGDTVIIHAGTYKEVIQPLTSGTPTAPITYKGAPGENMPLISGGGFDHPCCVAIGWVPDIGWDPKVSSKTYLTKTSVGYESNMPISYIVIDGLSISYAESNSPNSADIWGQDYNQPEGRFGYVTIGNHDSKGIVIKNCKIWQPGDVLENYTDFLRQSGIKYFGSGLLVENTEIFGVNWGIWLPGNAPRNVTIRNNNIHDLGQSAIDIGSPGSQILQATLIENNILGPTLNEDGIQFEPWYLDDSINQNFKKTYSNAGVIIRNNIFVHCGENSIDLKGAGYVLIEGNTAYGSPGQDDGGIKLDWSGQGGPYFKGRWTRGSALYKQENGLLPAENRGGGQGFVALGAGDTCHYIIIRNNIIYDNLSTTEMQNYYKVYNNTFVANNRDFTGDNSNWNPDTTGFLGLLGYSGQYWDRWDPTYMNYYGAVVKNNLICEHKHGEMAMNAWGYQDKLDIDYNIYANSKGVYMRDPGGQKWNWMTLPEWKERLKSAGVIGAEEHSRTANYSEIAFSNVPIPPVGPPSSFDFSLQDNSVAKNAGTYLTYAINGGSGRTIRVNDARVFYDGGGMPEESDVISVQCADGTVKSAKIQSIGDDNQTITLQTSLPSWNGGAHVTLESLGFTPTIGANTSGTNEPDKPPIITLNPSNQNVNIGESVSFNISATGKNLFYQWQKLVNSSWVGVANGNSSSYIINSAAASDNNTIYRCVVSNSAGSVNSNSATIFVDTTPKQPAITSNPSNLNISVGQQASFSVTATGTTPLVYQWRKNGIDISGATSPTYVIQSSAIVDSGTYDCRVSNNANPTGILSTSATLTVTAATVQPIVSNGSFENGDENWWFFTNSGGTFNVIKEGIIGYYAGKVIITSPGTNIQLSQNSFILESSTDYRLQFHAKCNVGKKIRVSIQQNNSPYTNYGVWEEFQLSDSWSLYTVNFTTPPLGTENTSDTRLMFWFAPYVNGGEEYYFDDIKIYKKMETGFEEPPTVTDTSATEKRVVINEEIILSANNTGTPPFIYQWQKNGINIPGAINSTYRTPPLTSGDDGSSYRYTVTNAYGSDTSGPIIIRIGDTSGPIKIQLTNQTVTAGQNAAFVFEVNATSQDEVEYNWYENGVPVFGGGRNASVYTKPSVPLSASGTKIKCVAMINAGDPIYSDEVILTVTNPPSTPTIKTQLINQSIAVGSNVTFTFEVNDNNPKDTDYTWYENGNIVVANIANATTYTKLNVQLGANGTKIKCVVVRSGGDIVYSNEATLTVTGGVQQPQIKTQLTNQTVMVGGDATFIFELNAGPEDVVEYGWYENNIPVSNFGGMNATTYIKHNVQLSANGTKIKCVGMINAGTPIFSDEVTLTVQGSTQDPRIKTQLANKTATVGDTVSFLFEVNDSDPKDTEYTWYQNNNPVVQNIINYTTYTKANVQIGDNGTKIRCTVIRSQGDIVQSDEITLTVVAKEMPPEPDTITIAKQPESLVAVYEGGSATFSVVVNVKKPEMLEYEWHKNGAVVTGGGGRQSSYTLSNVSIDDDGTAVQCWIIYGSQIAKSSQGILQVQKIITDALTITLHPQSVSRPVGSSAVFIIGATAKDPSQIKYRWYKNGKADISVDGSKSTYTIKNLTLEDDAAVIKCIVTYESQMISSKEAILTVTKIIDKENDAYISQQPHDIETTIGKDVTFSITVQAKEPDLIGYQWYKNGVLINDASARKSMFTIKKVSLADNKSKIKCVITYIDYSVTSDEVTLTVREYVDTSLEIISQPSDMERFAGSTAVFAVKATAKEPEKITYQWYKNGVPLLSIRGKRPTYTMTNLTLTDNNTKIKCDVFYYTTTIALPEVTLIVYKKEVDVPDDSLKILEQPRDVSVQKGNNAAFSVSASAKNQDLIKYKWYKNDSLVPDLNEKSPTYIISSASKIDNGSKIKCVVSYNTQSITTREALLSVSDIVPKDEAPPEEGEEPGPISKVLEITEQPNDQRVNIGERATFSYSVKGAMPHTYKWQKNGVDIEETIKMVDGTIYTTPPVKEEDDKSVFRGFVSNNWGTVATYGAILNVIIPKAKIPGPGEPGEPIIDEDITDFDTLHYAVVKKLTEMGKRVDEVIHIIKI